MSRLDPTIRVMCDTCKEDYDFDLTALAGGAWDARTLKAQMQSDGWWFDGGDRHMCPSCLEGWMEDHEEPPDA